MSENVFPKIIQLLKKWAEGKPELRKFWIYGSRAKGTANENSDLDLAYEIFPISSKDAQNEFREKKLPIWEYELQKISPWPVHVEAWAGNGTNVAGYVEEAGILVYERSRVTR